LQILSSQTGSGTAGRRRSSSLALLATLLALAIGAAIPAPAPAASAGELYAFGDNTYGQLGSATGFGLPHPTPTRVVLPGASGPAIGGAAGGAHSLALTSTGQLYAFGGNTSGQLGSAANDEPNPTPAIVSLPGATGPLTQVAAGDEDSLALTSTGQLYAFGGNLSGQLGIDTGMAKNPTPALVSLPGASGPVTEIAAGEAHGLALTSTGQLYAFGDNRYGQLGTSTNSGTTNPNPNPTLIALPGAGGPVTEIAVGANHSLALTSTGQLYAFGRNRYGQLGSAANEAPNPTPAMLSLPGATGRVTQIAAGDEHSLALTSTGQLYSFGYNYYGQLGNGTNTKTLNPNPTPATVSLPGATGPVTRIAAGAQHSLALTSSGQLYAFGNNSSGQLGNASNSGTTEPNPVPTLVDLGPGTTVDTMASGSFADHTLVVIANLAITTASLTDGRVGVPYAATASASGGTEPYSWQASGLPAGLSIDAASGQISGIPKKLGAAQVTFSVTDRFGIEASSAPLSLSVGAARPVVTHLRQSHRRWRQGRRLAKASSPATRTLAARPRKRKRPPVGTVFRFRLNEKARVRLAFAIRKGKRFRKTGALTVAGHKGKNRVRFQGRISHRKKLRPGRYKLTVTAKRDGPRSKPRTLRFTIVR
jgi:alpha-tubulin suppressor-like RCC1 family protein